MEQENHQTNEKHSISGDFRQGLLLLMVQKSQTTTCGMPTSTGATAGFLVAINSMCPLFGRFFKESPSNSQEWFHPHEQRCNMPLY